MTKNKNNENENENDNVNDNDNDNDNDNNIFFSLEENDSQNENDSDVDVSEILNSLGYTNEKNVFTEEVQIIDYNTNYTVKDLMLICEYYGIAKELKTNKCNKEEIIICLVFFENNHLNEDIVFKRQNMWFYINELKNDKFMKKYIFWK